MKVIRILIYIALSIVCTALSAQQKEYENPRVTGVNRESGRATFWYYSDRTEALKGGYENTPDNILLNGKWKFHFCEKPAERLVDFYQTGFDVSQWDDIDVPGSWPLQGYDKPLYMNHPYEFNYIDPYPYRVPTEWNPVGAFRRVVHIPVAWEGKRVVLHLGAVKSAFYVWVNGQKVGYSQDSKMQAEFDITSYIQPGRENVIAIEVYRFSIGSYLECQDFWRLAGIKRDVWLYATSPVFLKDFFAIGDLDEQYKNGELELNYTLKNTQKRKTSVNVSFSLLNKENKEIWTEQQKIVLPGLKEQTMNLKQVIEGCSHWTAETPNLYTLLIGVEEANGNTTYSSCKVGFRKVEVANAQLLVNGVPVYIKGANRHEHHPKYGHYIPRETMEKDVRLMKQFNINAIRTCHYPCDPYFYELCDKYGIYVVDEANIESHGLGAALQNVIDPQKHIACDPEWTDIHLDRMNRMFQRDKNHPSVIIWSMGNECGYGCTFEESLKWTKEFDPTRLTTYESAFYQSTDREYDYSNIDVVGRMYPAFSEIDEYMEKNPDKPLLLVEYCHAMGNGPGDLEDYFELIQKYDSLCGGFVWEWCDHAIYKGQAENGKGIYYYGGDHGEEIHDGNFCMDGLVYPDRTPHTGLKEYKNIYRPARVLHYDQETGDMVLHNYMNYVDLKDYIYLIYEVGVDGEVDCVGQIELDESIPAHEEKTIKLPVSMPDSGKCYLKVSYCLKNNTQILHSDESLGFDEILLKNIDGKNQKAIELLAEMNTDNIFTVEECDRYFTIHVGQENTYRFNRLTGLFESITVKGKELLTRPMELNIWRAPTDNDRKIKLEWMNAHYDQSYARAYETSCITKNGKLHILGTLSVSAPTVQKILDVKSEWIITSDGAIQVKMDVKRDLEFPMLPRFGIRLFLNRDFDNVEYYGIGPEESYADKRRAGSHGKYDANVLEMHEDYLRPQENGSHTDCDYLILKGQENTFAAAGERTFSFNVSPYTQEELTTKRHSYELQPCGSTVVCLDYVQNGIGSNSCGPELSEQYRLDAEQFNFEIKMIIK